MNPAEDTHKREPLVNLVMRYPVQLTLGMTY